MLDVIITTLTSVSCLSLLALILAAIFIYMSLPSHHASYPPMPRKPLPFVGHAAYLRPSPPHTLTEWKKEIGGIFSFYIGPQLYISLSSYEALRETLIKQGEYFTDLPCTFTLRVLQESEEGKMVGFGGPAWKEHRSVTLSILKTFGMGKNWMAEKISREVDEFVKAIGVHKGKPADIKLIANKAVANVICAMLVGHRFEYEDEYYSKMVELMTEKVALLKCSSVIDTFWWLEYLPGDLFHAKRIKHVAKQLNTKFGKYHIDQFKDSYKDDLEDNFIKAYLREGHKRKSSGLDTQVDAKNLVHIMDSLFQGGTETASTTILWSFVYAMNYPEAQRKVYEEILDVVGTERVPDLHDKTKMNYLNAFIMETQRLGSLAPIGIPHVCSKDVTACGYTIPKGAFMITHLDAVMKDEKTWGDPYVFRPERFLDKDKNLLTPDELVPFSVGKRYCLGESMAKMELFLFFASIYQRFEIIPEDPKNPPTMEPQLGLVFSPQPFNARFVERV